MTEREQELQFGQRMDKLGDKELMINEIINKRPERVLDLGAGTGLIAHKISEHGIHVDAVDHNFKIDKPQDTEFVTHYPSDIIRYVFMTSHKYDCIILSAVIHELDPRTRKQLWRGLKRIADKRGCMLVIREPYYEKLSNGLIRPFTSKAIQDKAYELSHSFLQETTIRTWNNAIKKHLNGHIDFTPKAIVDLNLAFAWSYGDNSWLREQHEYRFAYSKQQLIGFGKKVLGNRIKVNTYTYKDKGYAGYFKSRWLPAELAENLEYTNACMFFMSGKMQ